MAEFEQAYQDLAESERQKTPFQVIQLADHRDIRDAVAPQFSVHAHVDGHELRGTAETAKEAFAKAIEWRIVGRLADVSISDGTRSYSIVEFSSVMALAEIAHTIKGDINTDEDMLQKSKLARILPSRATI
jgi:hypothetical protein